jgi:cytochrome b
MRTTVAGKPGASDRVRVWDLPLRVFHWTLLVLVAVAFITALVGSKAMVWHGRAGVGIAGLLVFRLVWGIAGSTYARFAHFVRSPQAVRDYLAGRWEGIGHNPLGALSVLAMLAALAVQVATGLAANDDIAFNGPLYPLVTHQLSNALTELHEGNAWIVGTLIVLHIAAIAFYARIKKENLVLPMIRGWKVRRNVSETSHRGGGIVALIVALTLALAAAWGASGKWIPAPPPPPPGQTAPDF